MKCCCIYSVNGLFKLLRRNCYNSNLQPSAFNRFINGLDGNHGGCAPTLPILEIIRRQTGWVRCIKVEKANGQIKGNS